MTTQESNEARTLAGVLATLQVTEAIGHANLTLAPLQGGGRQHLDYMLAAEAIAAGSLAITEVNEAGHVPELLAVNNGLKLVLLLDGEELVGAKQNRILNTTVLLPPKSRTKIPVSCVEQGRWRHVSREFSAGAHSPSSLRGRNSRGVTASLRSWGRAESNQGEVWDQVAECVADAAVSAPTMAMHEVVEQRRESLDAYVDALPYPAGALGVMAAINGQFVAADVFDQPATLERVWRRLVAGYAIDALGRQKDKPVSFSAKAAGVLLEHVGQIPCTACPTVGLGEDWRFDAPDIVGKALVLESVCAHLSAFPNDFGQERQAGYDSRIMPPSHRRRHRGPSTGETVY